MNFYEISNKLQMSAVVSQVEVQKVKQVPGWVINPEQWVGSKTSKRMVKIGGKTFKKMFNQSEESDKLKKVSGWITNPEQWVQSETSKRMVKIGSDTHKKMLGETVEKKVIDRTGTVLNPTGTGRYIKINGKLYKKLKAESLIPQENIC